MFSSSASQLYRGGGDSLAILSCQKHIFRSSDCRSISRWAAAFMEKSMENSIEKFTDPIATHGEALGQSKNHLDRGFQAPTRPAKPHLFSVCHRHRGGDEIVKNNQQRSNIRTPIPFLTKTRLQHYISKRTFRAGISFSDKSTTTTPSEETKTHTNVATPLNAEEFQSKLLSHIPAMADSLLRDGYYTTVDLLPTSTIVTLRNQSISLRFDHNRFEASYSETIDETTGRVKERFEKEGVYACEPDGRDYYEATDLITYMSLLLQTLPVSLNAEWEKTSVHIDHPPFLSNESFNAKLAVTEHGGSKYPLHVDNPQGMAAGDTRKLTCILYLNPGHEEADGGEIRLFLPSETTWQTMDFDPIGGRLLAFWSDEIPHEVLPTAVASEPSSSSNHEKDRYALTVWIPTSDIACLHNASSKFHNLKELVFEATNNNTSENKGGP